MGELNNPLYIIFLTREIYSLHEKKFFLSRGKNIPFVGVYFAKLEIPLQLNKKGELRLTFISLSFDWLNKATSAFMLFGAEVFPLCLHLAVFFQLGVAFGIFVIQLLVNGDEGGEEQCIHAFALIFGLHGY